MKYYLYSLCFLLTGCITKSPISGKTKIAGIPIPFTGNGGAETDTNLSILMEQLEPLIWVALLLIIFGVYWWWFTKGRTGLGRLSVGLGSVFFAVAIIVPQIIGWVALITVISLILVLIYFTYTFYSNRKK